MCEINSPNQNDTERLFLQPPAPPILQTADSTVLIVEYDMQGQKPVGIFQLNTKRI